jgi:hypothetical protein
MLRFLLICIAFLGSTITIMSQNYELGKVTIAELNEKVHSKDSSAPAAILFKKGRTHFGYNREFGFYANHVCEIKTNKYLLC